jgi:gluconokinase
MAVVLALDIGSSFAKAQRFDEAGSAVGALSRRPTHIGRNGQADMEEVVAGVEALVDDAMGAGPDPAAVALSSAWHTLVGVDGNGQPTTELSTWIDDRASGEASELRAAVADEGDVHDRIGAPIHPSFPSARMLWLARNEADAFSATRRWCSLPEFVASRWFADTVGPSHSIASGTGLYDQRANAWDAELLAAVGVAAETLATVDDEPRTSLAPAYRARWPALAGVPWFPALGDGACAAIGADCATPGRAALTVGTSAAVRVLTDHDRRWAAPLPSALFGYLVEADVPVVGAARSNAGAAAEWAADVLGIKAMDPVIEATAGRLPGSHGLEADPSLITERSPSWPVSPTARLGGLRRTTTAMDILQAFVEAVAVGVADAVDAVEQWAGPQTLVLGGGASMSAGWRHLLADTLGRPIARSPIAEESARGAALAAFARMGASAPPAPTGEELVDPDPERADAFAHVRAAQADRPFAASLGP